MNAPRQSRGRTATHIGALLLLALGAPAAMGAETATESEALPPLVQGQVLLQRETMSLEGRVSRIEGYLPHLATKADVQELRADLRATEGLLRAEIQEGLRTQLLHFLWVMGGMLTVLFGIQLLVAKFLLLPAAKD